MRKKKTMILLLALMTATTITAARYKILYLNFPKILINGKSAKVGDIFNEKATIRWTEERQAMKVIDLDSHRRYLMTAKPAEKKELTAYDILTRNKHLSTHENGVESGSAFDRLEASIEEEYDLLDQIEIKLPTGIVLDNKHYLQVSYEYGDTRLAKKLQVLKNQIIIDKTLFVVDGKRLDPRDVEITIDYIDDQTGEVIFIKDHIQLSVYPEN